MITEYSMFKKHLFLCLALSISTFADDYSETKAYDMIADEKCYEAADLISSEQRRFAGAFLSGPEKISKGSSIVADINSVCKYVSHVKYYLKWVNECNKHCALSSAADAHAGESDYNNLQLVKKGSPKLKKYLQSLKKSAAEAELILPWKTAGFKDADEIKLFMKNKIPVDTALSWQAGTREDKYFKKRFTAQEMVDWRKAGYDAQTAFTFQSNGVSPSMLQKRKKRYDFFSSDKYGGNATIADWVKCDIDDETLFKWADISQSCEDVKKWLKQNIDFEEAKKWSIFDKKVDNTILIMNSGIEFDILTKWAGKGFTMYEIKVYNAAKISPEEALEWKEKNIDADKAVAWKKEGFCIKDREVARWSTWDVPPKEAKVFIKNRIDATEYVMFTRYLGIDSPQKISASLDIVRQKCKIAKNKYVADNTGMIDEIGDENPYETKGKCYGGSLYFSKLKSRNEAYFVNSNDQPVLVKWNKSIPVKGAVFGFFYSKGATIHKNALGVETILPNLDAVFLTEQKIEDDE